MAAGIYLWECKPTKNKYVGKSEHLHMDCSKFMHFNIAYGNNPVLETERTSYPSMEFWKYTILEKCNGMDLEQKQKEWERKINTPTTEPTTLNDNKTIYNINNKKEGHINNIRQWYRRATEITELSLLFKVLRKQGILKKFREVDELLSSVDITIPKTLTDKYKLTQLDIYKKLNTLLKDCFSTLRLGETSTSYISIARGITLNPQTGEIKLTLNKILYEFIVNNE